jgi:superfamily II DNA or RNA helicase
MTSKLHVQLKPFMASAVKNSKYVDKLSVEMVANKRIDGYPTRKASKDGLASHGGPRKALEYQQEVIGRIVERFAACSGRTLLSLPTGAGKTFTAMRIVLSLLREMTNCIWLAPQTVLVDQAYNECMRSWWEEPREYPLKIRRVGSVGDTTQADSSGIERMILVSTIQKALRWNWKTDRVGILVFDEAHYLQHNEFANAIEKLMSNSTRLIGLSATPGRNSSQEQSHLSEFFKGSLTVPRRLGPNPVAELTKGGVYSKISWDKIERRHADEDVLVERRKGKVSRSLAALSASRLDAVIEYIASHHRSHKILVFAQSHAHSVVIAAGLSKLNISYAIVGSFEREEVNQYSIACFREGEIRVIINVKYLAVGADIPSADLAILTVPIGSPIMFEQIVGRVSRGIAVGGTEHAVVAEFDDHRSMHGNLKSYARFEEMW